MQLIAQSVADCSVEGDATDVVAEVPVKDGSGSDEEEYGANLHLEDDAVSGEIREYTGSFEGPEKTLEVVFRSAHSDGSDERLLIVPPSGTTSRKVGLRRLHRRDLDKICRRARCEILSSISNQYLDAYVLSESSLFVYPHMLVLKTCGTTTLLRCVAVLIELGRRIGLEVDWVGYSRKNFSFPGDQAFPHQSFHQELEYLYSHRSLCERLDGNGYTLGPVTADHWFVFVADQTIRRNNTWSDTDRVLNIMMFDIDETVAKTFYYDAYDKRSHADETEEEAVRRISSEQTKRAGIDTLCPGAIIDPRAFEPCGYSMNAVLFRSYYTMHITPEDGSSYASFETNQRTVSYSSLISNVVRAFRPKKVVMTLMADEAGHEQMKDDPFTCPASKARIFVPAKRQGGNVGNSNLVYRRKEVASITVEEDCLCMMGNWILCEESNCQENPQRRPRGESVA